MKDARRLSRKVLLFVFILGLLCWLSGCAVTPPDRAPAASQSTPQAASQTGTVPEATSVAAASQAPAEATARLTVVGEGTQGKIRQVDVFFDATLPMMGFVDTHAVSLYGRFLDLLSTSIARSFPNAQRSNYRADIERADVQEALLPQENLMQEAAQPSFYLVERLTHLPDKVQRTGQSNWQPGGRMGTFISSYYQAHDIALPAGTPESPSPVTWAVRHSTAGDDRVTLLLTDLSELQLHTGTLTQAMREHAFIDGNTVGLLVLSSEFSGLVPMEASGTIWQEWGALPSGALDKMLDYGPYTLGITQAAEERGEAARPFYLLCIGQSDVVSDFLAMVRQQLAVSFSDQPPEAHTLVYELDFVGTGADIARDTRLTGYSQSGINVSASELAQTGSSYVQLQKAAGGADRYVEFAMSYLPKATDPRAGAFLPEDFTLTPAVYALSSDGVRGEEIKPAGAGLPVSLSLGQNSADRVEIIARLSFPYGSLPEGDFQVALSLTLQPPAATATPDWVRALSSDLTEQQNAESFDGSKTIGLEGFLTALSGLQEARLKPAPLGEYTFPLYVVVNEQ